MTQTWFLVALFIGAMASLPWLVKRLQQRQVLGGVATGAVPKVLGAASVGPQQKVVTVEVGADAGRTVLVLGVTPHQVTCLHVLSPATGGHPMAPVTPATFTEAMAVLDAKPIAKDGHG